MQEVTLLLPHGFRGNEPGGRRFHMKPLLITAFTQCQQKCQGTKKYNNHTCES